MQKSVRIAFTTAQCWGASNTFHKTLHSVCKHAMICQRSASPFGFPLFPMSDAQPSGAGVLAIIALLIAILLMFLLLHMDPIGEGNFDAPAPTLHKRVVHPPRH